MSPPLASVGQHRLRRVLAHLATIALCFWSLYVQVAYRLPGRVVFLVLPWVTIAMAILSVVLLIKDLLVRLSADDPLSSGFALAERCAGGIVGLFACYSLVLYVNGRFDSFAAVTKSTELVEISTEASTMSEPVLLSWAALRSWEHPGRHLHVVLTPKEQRTLWAGEPVLVQVRQG